MEPQITPVYSASDSSVVITEIRNSDGYLNATKLCQVGGKMWGHYWENKQTRRFIDTLSLSISLSVELLIQKQRNAKNSERHTWVHPQVATHLACWISPDFASDVTAWIEVAKKRIPDIQSAYFKSLGEIDDNKFQNCREKKIRDRLCAELDGKPEVFGVYGAIDIVTNDEVIEIKYAPKFTHALGQVLGHFKTFPQKAKRIHLFGSDDEIDEFVPLARKLCEDFDVKVTFEIVDDVM